jgi:S-adenosylmethionine hydrolase
MSTFQSNGIITFTTDFGIMDAYVAIMKGVVLGITPHATLIDYTHGIIPGNIIQAAYLLHSGYRYFPRGTVHLVVVDPGVGSRRRAIALQTPEAAFVGPDNGVLAKIAADAQHEWGDSVRLIELTEPSFWLPNPSPTFHGRDIFAPVAAQIVKGTSFTALGRPIDKLVQLEKCEPKRVGENVLVGQIIHIDQFGNCITNITYQDLQNHGIGDKLVTNIIDQQLSGLFRTYSDGEVGIPMSLIGSSGHLELAVRNGSAAKQLGVGIGDKCRVRRTFQSLEVGD